MSPLVRQVLVGLWLAVVCSAATLSFLALLVGGAALSMVHGMWAAFGCTATASVGLLALVVVVVRDGPQ